MSERQSIPPPPFPSSDHMDRLYRAQRHKPVFVFNPLSVTLDITQPVWEDLLGVQCCDSGAGGVFFCTAASGSFVVKSTTHAAPEYFTNLLYRKLGINVPEMRVVQWSNGEYQRMVEEMKLCCYSEVKTKTKVRRELDRAYALVMEYIPGFSLIDMGPSRLLPSLQHASPLFQQIGHILAGDLLVNNSDRIPLVWHNQGNANNLLFQLNPAELTLSQLQDLNFPLEVQRIVAIDSRCYCIPQGDNITKRNYESYMQRVEQFLVEIIGNLRGKEKEITGLAPFLRFFRDNGGLEVTFDQQMQLLKGLISGLARISALTDSDLSSLLSEVQALVQEDWMNIWQEEVAHIRLSFLQSVRDLVQRHIGDLEEVVPAVE